jgi:hypothetical protein
MKHLHTGGPKIHVYGATIHNVVAMAIQCAVFIHPKVKRLASLSTRLTTTTTATATTTTIIITTTTTFSFL